MRNVRVYKLFIAHILMFEGGVCVRLLLLFVCSNSVKACGGLGPAYLDSWRWPSNRDEAL